MTAAAVGPSSSSSFVGCGTGFGSSRRTKTLACLVAITSGLRLLFQLRYRDPSSRYYDSWKKKRTLPQGGGVVRRKNYHSHDDEPPPLLQRTGPPPQYVSRFNLSLLEGLSSVDYMACCGLGHRLTRMSNAYLVARRMGLALRAFWGYCAGDNNNNDTDTAAAVEVFHHLFGPTPWEELEQLVLMSTNNQTESEANAAATITEEPKLRWGNQSLDHYVRMPNEVHHMQPLRRSDGRRRQRDDKDACMCTRERIESDRIFYSSLQRRFRFRHEVDAFRAQHFGRPHGGASSPVPPTPPVIGVHIRAGNGEQGQFANRRREVADLDAWLRALAHRLQSRSEWDQSIVFVATDTARVIPRLQELLQHANTTMKVVSLEQSRPKDGEGVLFGEYGKVVDTGGEQCLRGWVDSVLDMMLLSHTDVVIAARPSSFTQTMPLNMVFETEDGHDASHPKEFCELDRDANEMACYSSVMDWCCNATSMHGLRTLITVPATNTSHPDMYDGFQRRIVVTDSNRQKVPANTSLDDRARCPPQGPGDWERCIAHDWSVFYPESQRQRQLVRSAAQEG